MNHTLHAPSAGAAREGARTAAGVWLGAYHDQAGWKRELIAIGGAAASVLVIDRDVRTRGDRRLVAHLAADEPDGNAAVVCDHYLKDTPERRRRCRALTVEDLHTAPAMESAAQVSARRSIADGSGSTYVLERSQATPELRWRLLGRDGEQQESRTLSVRDVVAALESYEPVCSITTRILTDNDAARHVSTAVLRVELGRVQRSPIVLNRGLREAVLATVRRGELSMSEIAIRCGRVKRDRKGNESGETSWLARRLGLLAEAGQSSPTPWIHNEVLGLIAWRGLGIGPREVELG